MLLVAAVVANVADLAAFLRASPRAVAVNETSPLPHLLGQVPGALVAKLIAVVAITVIAVVFRRQARVRAGLLVLYTIVGFVGAASALLVR
jgi:hypothetical protein